MAVVVERPKPTLEDYARAASYLVLATWAVVFWFFPPVSFVSEIAIYSRAIWLGIAFVGAAAAFAGAVSRIDLKLEFPGLLAAVVGPVFYTISQIYLSANPLPETVASARYGVAVYAAFGAVALTPRLFGLLLEKNRQKSLRPKGPRK